MANPGTPINVMRPGSGEDPKLQSTLKNASYRGGRAANLIVLTIPQPKAVVAYGLCGPAQAKQTNYEEDKRTLTVTSGR